MGRLQWGPGRGDSAFAALVVGGIAVALGGAALFGMVAHTWTPFLPQRGAGASPFDQVARGPSSTPLKRPDPGPSERRRNSIPFDPRPDEFQLAQAAGPAAMASAPPDSLAPRESVVVSAAPQASAEPKRVEANPLDTAAMDFPRPVLAQAVLAEPPAIVARVVEASVEPRPVVIRVADVKVVGAGGGKAVQTEIRLVQSRPLETSAVKAKPVEPKPPAPKLPEPKAVAAKVAAPRGPEPRPAATKVAEGKPAAPKAAESKPVAPRVAEAKPVAPKAIEAKPAPKVAVASRVEPKPVALKVAAARPLEVQRADVKRASDVKPAEARRAETRRAADMKALEARFAETRRAAEMKEEIRLAESKRAAEMKAAEERLAQLNRAAEVKAAEDRLAETQRAFETKAAQARLAETKRAVETTLAEARLAEARLAETKRAVEMTIAQAKPVEVKPALETRVSPAKASPRYYYDSCDNCGTVSGVVLRSQDHGTRKWEVRVNFPDGMQRIFYYPTDPGFSSGERVRFEAGMLTRLYPRRSGTYAPA